MLNKELQNMHREINIVHDNLVINIHHICSISSAKDEIFFDSGMSLISYSNKYLQIILFGSEPFDEESMVSTLKRSNRKSKNAFRVQMQQEMQLFNVLTKIIVHIDIEIS